MLPFIRLALAAFLLHQALYCSGANIRNLATQSAPPPRPDPAPTPPPAPPVPSEPLEDEDGDIIIRDGQDLSSTETQTASPPGPDATTSATPAPGDVGDSDPDTHTSTVTDAPDSTAQSPPAGSADPDPSAANGSPDSSGQDPDAGVQASGDGTLDSTGQDGSSGAGSASPGTGPDPDTNSSAGEGEGDPASDPDPPSTTTPDAANPGSDPATNPSGDADGGADPDAPDPNAPPSQPVDGPDQPPADAPDDQGPTKPNAVINVPAKAEVCSEIVLSAKGSESNLPDEPDVTYTWSNTKSASLSFVNFLAGQKGEEVKIPRETVYAAAKQYIARNPGASTIDVEFTVEVANKEGGRKSASGTVKLSLSLGPPSLTLNSASEFTISKKDSVSLSVTPSFCPLVQSKFDPGVTLQWTASCVKDPRSADELLRLDEEQTTATLRPFTLIPGYTYTVEASIRYTANAALNASKKFTIRVRTDKVNVRLQFVKPQKENS